ncbi:MAG: hypothetical protein NC915_01830 [Candidatus Omnitrophica bacterium]|nr:hypothetical protein [Candidatus Omnitrophota bacterium]
MKTMKILFLYLLIMFSFGFTEAEENIIKNGSFEDGLNYWKISIPEYIKIELDQQEKKDQKFSLKIFNTTTSEEKNYIYLSQMVEIKPSSVYKISWSVKSREIGVLNPGPQGAFGTLHLVQRDENKKIITGGKLLKSNNEAWLRGSQFTGQNITEDIEWSDFYIIFETSPNTKFIEIYLCYAYGGNLKGTLWFDNISLISYKESEEKTTLMLRYKEKKDFKIDTDFLFFVRNYLEMVFPESLPKKEEIKEIIETFATIGEYEPVMFCIRSKKEIKNLEIKIRKLEDKSGKNKISEENIDIRIINYLPKKMNGGGILAPVLLSKFEKIDISKNYTYGFYITFKIPENIEGGFYEGSLIMKGEGFYKEIPIKIEVFPYQLKEPDIFWGMFDGVKHFLPDYNKEDYFEKKFKDMREHGMTTVFMFGAGIPVKIDENKNLILNLDGKTDWERMMNAYKKTGFTKPIVINGIIFELPNEIKSDEQNFEENYKNLLKLYKKISKEKNFPEIYIQPVDEPFSGGRITIAEKFFKLLKEEKFITVANQVGVASESDFKRVYPFVDIFVYNCGPFIKLGESYKKDRWKEHLEKLIADNKKIWYYSFDASAWNSESMRFAYGLLLWLTGGEGMITYAYQRPYYVNGKDIYNDLNVPKNNYIHYYPEFEKGLSGPTTGWEGAREGVDDYKYLYTFFTILNEKKKIVDNKGKKILEEKEKEVLKLISNLNIEGLPSRNIFFWTDGKEIIGDSGYVSGSLKVKNGIEFDDYQKLRKEVALKTIEILKIPHKN